MFSKHTIQAASTALFVGLSLTVTTASANLITNGDFEAGNTAFNTALTHGGLGQGGYIITTDPSLGHPAASSYGDYTSGSGNMFAVNGSATADLLVWGQDNIAVTANTSYDFAAYIASWTSSNPAQLQFSINDFVIGTIEASTTTGEWDLAFANWDSGSATTANIKIINNNTVGSGNDFSLDDIYFGLGVYTDPSLLISNPPSPSPSPSPSALVSTPGTLALMSLGLIGFSSIRRKKITE